MVDDKDIDSVMELLPKDATYYFTKGTTKRAINEEKVYEKAQHHGLKGEKYPDVKTAYEAALKDASAEDFIFVGGSSYIVSDFLFTCF
jgi:dihydrofolate synthase/folylpolyglutamate synthase